jgi:hypothetical protein
MNGWSQYTVPAANIVVYLNTSEASANTSPHQKKIQEKGFCGNIKNHHGE